MEFGKVPQCVRKAKKKPVKDDELDRIKQAEKKKRRLEKALANSAAIRSELEKKKLKKIEEQKRLDDEGAAIAEAVALNVLLGEDSDENLNNICDSISNIEFIGKMGLAYPYRNFPQHEIEAIKWLPNVYGNYCDEWENGHSSVLSGTFRENDCMPYSDEISIASLQISENAYIDPRIFNNVLRG